MGLDPDGQRAIDWYFSPGQAKALNSTKRIILVSAGWQSGKALDVGTPIPTPDGFVPMMCLNVGDLVFDDRGETTSIVAVSPVMTDRQCRRVVFSDGAEIVADDEHEWVTRCRELGKRTTAEIAATIGSHHFIGGRRILSADRSPSVPVKCIQVAAESGMYLCSKHFIPTHNSEIGPPWLLNEMARMGPGDYLVASPTFMLMMKKVLPIFVRLFERLMQYGRFAGGRNIFEFSDDGSRRLWGYVPDDPARVLFGHAGDPDSLESATVKSAWLDECGQKSFKLESYEAILGRLSISQGRVLLTSRPYTLSWMKKLIWDPWQATDRNHPLIDVINFRSIDNPAFPPEEYYRAKAEMPPWKFNMKYNGLPERPAGLIYSSFSEERHKVPRFEIPPEWKRFVGLDFGGVNTAAIYFAKEPGDSGRYYAYREYLTGDRSAAEHCYYMMKGDEKNASEPRTPTCVGGSKSEGQWRREFAAGGTVRGVRVAGIPILAPTIVKGDKDSIVEVGINRVFKAFAMDQIWVFDDLVGLLDEVGSYSRELDDAGEPTEKIQDKETYHRLDACRYLFSHLNPDRPRVIYSGSVVAKKGPANL
ncbi:MAG: hypothetical protein ACHP7J_00115 [Terriglobales bacterium]